jgi:hypothetical protein
VALLSQLQQEGRCEENPQAYAGIVRSCLWSQEDSEMEEEAGGVSWTHLDRNSWIPQEEPHSPSDTG